MNKLSNVPRPVFFPKIPYFMFHKDLLIAISIPVAPPIVAGSPACVDNLPFLSGRFFASRGDQVGLGYDPFGSEPSRSTIVAIYSGSVAGGLCSIAYQVKPVRPLGLAVFVVPTKAPHRSYLFAPSRPWKLCAPQFFQIRKAGARG